MRLLKSSGRGFTLVELLVVIGIIALLISMLLPALGKAKAQANWVRCQKNMSQIGVMLTQYMNDSEGWMYAPLRGADKAPDQRWTVYVFGVWNPAVMICPSDVDPADEHSYILNSHLWEKRIKYTTRELGGRPPSDVVVMGEKKSSAPDYYMDAGETFAIKVELFRHGLQLGSNYLYMDGHVDKQRNKDEVLKGIDPWDLPKTSTTPP